MSKIIVLGAGMVGRAMAIDLTSLHDVTLTDLSSSALESAKLKSETLSIKSLDVTNKEVLMETIKPYDLVICAVPGFLGFETLRSIIEAKKNVVDISFFPENALDLHDLAKANGVTAIVDCGVAPGLDNLILGYWNEKMEISNFECLVGGLPKTKKWPFNYKAPFSPVDVIEEYTRPARYVENGKIITREALTDVEHIEFDRIGTLESFNSDGLRSIISTMPHIPNMKEKTLRYPGHVEYISVLKSSGFFSQDKIGDLDISPLDFTSKVLFNEWKLGMEEEELTVMRVTVNGKNESSSDISIIYDLYDEFNSATKTSSMSRTTGYTATAVANWMLETKFDTHGVFPPELIGGIDGCLDYILEYLENREIKLKVQMFPSSAKL